MSLGLVPGVSCVYPSDVHHFSGTVGEQAGRKSCLRRYFRGRTEVGVI